MKIEIDVAEETRIALVKQVTNNGYSLIRITDIVCFYF